MTRECRYCGETKDLEDFVEAKRCHYGRSHRCKACRYQDTKKWRAANPERQKALEHARDEELRSDAYLAKHAEWKVRCARERGANIVEQVNWLVVLERDDGVCGICGEDVDPFDFSVDHIVACQHGGDHSYENVQLAHMGCNTAKRHEEERARG